MRSRIRPKRKWLRPKPVGGHKVQGSGMNPSVLPFGHPAIKSGPKKRHPRIPRGLPGTPMGVPIRVGAR